MNAYWDAVRPYVVDGVIRRDWPFYQMWADGMRMRYSWTVTDPATVEFVVPWCAGCAIDPFAGNGWLSEAVWPQASIYTYDIAPPSEPWCRVERADAVDVMQETARSGWPLILSWPPLHDDIGERTIRAYRGNRIVHLGARGRTADGTDDMYRLLADEWVQVAQHTPVRWYGVQDYVTVYERR